MQVIDNDISLLTVSRVLELTKDIYEEILEYEKLNQSKAKTKAKHIKKNLKYREDRNYEC